MEYVGLTAAATHAFVGGLCKVERLGDEFNLSAVISRHIGVAQALEGSLYHLFVTLFLRCHKAKWLFSLRGGYLLLLLFFLDEDFLADDEDFFADDFLDDDGLLAEDDDLLAEDDDLFADELLAADEVCFFDLPAEADFVRLLEVFLLAPAF